MKTITCSDCQGAGWYETETFTESCVICNGAGTIEIAPTPGPWSILEVWPVSDDDTRAGLYVQAPEGHMSVYSSGHTSPCVEIRSSITHMDHLFGSGNGGLVAQIPVAHGETARQQALANAAIIARIAALEAAARALLEKIDSITTEDFALGAERAEREALRAVLEGVEA